MRNVRQCALVPLLAICVWGGGLPAGANTLVQQALEEGEIDAATAALYQVQSIRDPQALPQHLHQVSTTPTCATPLMVQACHLGRQADEQYQARLAKVLARPTLEHSYVTPSGRFRIHYDLAGFNAIDPLDEDGNGTPDYVDLTSSILDDMWVLQIDQLGYPEPPLDNGQGGGDEYDFYILELGNRAYGYTTPDGFATSTSSYTEMDNNYTDALFQQTRGLDALQVTLAHEFFHLIHYGYYAGVDALWWFEASSTWMEEVAFPDVDDYLQYVPTVLLSPSRSINSGARFSSDLHVYGISLFAHFLDGFYERDIVRQIWQEISARANSRLENFDRVIRRHPQGGDGLAAAMNNFAVWNYFTGQRHRSGFYPEGDRYPTSKSSKINTVAKFTVEDSGRVDHLGAAYVRLEPQLQPGGVRISTELSRGQWGRQIILVERDSVTVQTVNLNPIQISGWDRYEEVALVLTSTEQEGLGFSYTVSVEYDPDFSDEASPTAFKLHQNYPNPFAVDTQEHTTMAFDLDRPGAVAQLSIFSAAGDLVRQYNLGGLGARAQSQVWDGRNEVGELVGSGIYHYILDVDGRTAKRSLAVVRGE
jgi:hypothetical protein